MPCFLRRAMLGMLCCAATAAAGQNQTLKSWNFPLQRGAMSVSLLRGSGDRLVLSFGSLPCGACAFPGELDGVLRQVLQSMVAERLDPHRLTMIEARVSGANAKRALAEAALRSPEWQACMRRRVCGGEGLMVKLLNESGAFAGFDDALKPYRLTLRTASAEKISLERAGTVEGLTLPAGTRGTARVPVDGSLELLVEARK